MRHLSILLGVLLLAGLGCVTPEDSPSAVKDLRVLGMRVDPPEIMMDGPCLDREAALQRAQAQLAQLITFTALIADPAGAGRVIRYELRGCASQSDRTCDEDKEQIRFGEGTTSEGELTLPLIPNKDPRPFLQAVYEEDVFRGLGGLRVPLVLHIQAGDEEVYAQKLMVYSCQIFSDMKANVTPVLPGVRALDTPWKDSDVPLFIGRQPVPMEPEDFWSNGLQESYVVPSFELAPVRLEERWKISWHTTLGRFSPNETGGTDLGSQSARHNVNWNPPAGVSVATDVTFWMVVRDGRGGQSWLRRTARYLP